MPLDPLPSLTGLAAFEAAARHLSFTAAAAELCVTQSAVSHQIRKLEKELGYPLFQRQHRRIELTAEGEVLAKTTLQSFQLLRRTLARLGHQARSGVVTVSVSPSFAIRWLVPRLESFHAENPDLEVRLSATDRLVDPEVEAIDLCIRYGPGGYHGVDEQRLVTDQVFPVCSPRLVERGLVDPSALPGFRLLHDEMFASHPERPDWKRWGGLAGVDIPDGGPRFSHAHMAIAAAIAGHGVALGRSSLVADDLEAGSLVSPFGPSFPAPFSYWVVTPQGGLTHPRVSTFVQWLRTQLGGDE